MMIRAVVDTNILFDGLTRQSGVCFAVVRAWQAGLFHPIYCNTVAFEYFDVCYRKLSTSRWDAMKPQLAALMQFASQQEIYFRWRPASPDPGDDHVIECALNADAVIVTLNEKDFRRANKRFAIPVFTPSEFITLL